MNFSEINADKQAKRAERKLETEVMKQTREETGKSISRKEAQDVISAVRTDAAKVKADADFSEKVRTAMEKTEPSFKAGGLLDSPLHLDLGGDGFAKDKPPVSVSQSAPGASSFDLNNYKVIDGSGTDEDTVLKEGLTLSVKIGGDDFNFCVYKIAWCLNAVSGTRYIGFLSPFVADA